MSDIVTRLRDWVHSVDAVPAGDLMDEAADEIAILRADNNRRANLEQGLRDGIVRLSANADCPGRDNAANEDNTPAANDTPREGSEQDRCTLTDAEREAVEQAAIRVESLCQRGSQHMAATLRGLLERMA